MATPNSMTLLAIENWTALGQSVDFNTLTETLNSPTSYTVSDSTSGLSLTVGGTGFTTENFLGYTVLDTGTINSFTLSLNGTPIVEGSGYSLPVPTFLSALESSVFQGSALPFFDVWFSVKNTISGTAAIVEGNLANLLPEYANINAINITSGAVSVSVANFQTYENVLNTISGGFTISDSSTNVQAGLALLEADVAHINSIDFTNPSPTITITAAEKQADAAVLAKITTPYVLDVGSQPPNFFGAVAEAGVLWQNTNGDVELWNPNGSGGFTYDSLGAVNSSWQIAGTGAFNGASEAGILWRNTDGSVELWNSNGSGGFTYDNLGSVSSSWQIAETGNLSGDGEGILWRNTNGDTELWNPNGSGGFTYDNLGTVNTSWQIAGSGDFNGSGEDGILWRNNANGDVEIWNSNGSGGFTYDNLGAVSSSWQVAGTGDLTGTGEASILWRNTNGDTELWNPNGSGGFTYDNLGVVNTSWQIVETGDFSGNGQSGILWRNNTNGDTELWNPNGSGGFTYDNLGVVNTSWSVHKIFA
jgi:hypothetical protein